VATLIDDEGPISPDRRRPARAR